MSVVETNGARARIFGSLAVPIVFALAAQSLMGLINVAMVSHLGEAALAGVGVANAVFSMLIALLFGVNTAVQALVARTMGSEIGDSLASARSILSDAVKLSAVVGVLLAIGICLVARDVIGLASQDPEAVERGTMFVFGIAPLIFVLGINIAFGGLWYGAGLPIYALLPIVVQLPCDIFLNYALIYGHFGLPRLETAGAGIASTVSGTIALTMHLIFAYRQQIGIGRLLRETWDFRRTMAMIRIGLPVSIQQFLVYLGLYVFYFFVGLLGVRELAVANVLNVIIFLPIISATGMGIAAATLVGQALGRDDRADATQWGWDAARVGGLVFLAIGLVIFLLAEPLLALLIQSGPTVSLGVLPLQVFAVAIIFDALARILSYAARGAGATAVVTIVSLLVQWCIQLPLVWYVGVVLTHGLVGIALVYLFACCVEFVVMTYLWQRGGWATANHLSNTALSITEPNS